MADLRAGLLGIGQMGQHHARALDRLPDVDLVGAYDPGDRGGADHPFPLCRSLDELLALDLDLPSWPPRPSPTSSSGWRWQRRGCPTLIEKPVAATVDEAYQLARAFRDAGVIGCVGHIERFNPALQEMRRRLDEGQLGEIYQVSTRRIGPFPARIADVGVVLDLATHDIDLTAWVTRAPYRTVSAQSAHRSGRRHEDLVAVVATLGDGTVANHLVNWLSPMKERITVVTGERGSLVADTLTHGPDVLRERRGPGRVGDPAALQGSRPGGHDPLRDPEARAAHGRAHRLPRRGARGRSATR